MPYMATILLVTISIAAGVLLDRVVLWWQWRCARRRLAAKLEDDCTTAAAEISIDSPIGVLEQSLGTEPVQAWLNVFDADDFRRRMRAASAAATPIAPGMVGTAWLDGAAALSEELRRQARAEGWTGDVGGEWLTRHGTKCGKIVHTNLGPTVCLRDPKHKGRC